MLMEIWSDKFISHNQIRKKIEFNKNLNVVLGADDASNSIGKSSLLMAIDFAFGGEDYAMDSSDIIKNVGHHFVNFKFVFDEEEFYFTRNTADISHVIVCDNNYSPMKVQSSEAFKDFLFEKYEISIPHISFRNIVSRYLRIYGRENSNEKRPLHVVHNEKTGVPVNSLIKLFNKYDAIEAHQNAVNDVNDVKEAHNKAQKYTLIPSINKSKYGSNIIDIKKLQLELEQLQYAKEDMFASSNENADEFIELKKERSRLKRYLTSLENELKIVDRKVENGRSQNNYDELSSFFENTNIKHLDEINNFHQKIYDILRQEFDNAKSNIKLKIEDVIDSINLVEQKMRATGYSQSLPKGLVQRISEITNKIATMKNENNQYDRSLELKYDYDSKNRVLTNVRKDITQTLEKLINKKMDEINDLIYNGKKTPPQLTLHENNDYTFEIINDSGTGAKYRGLLIFDLVVLNETVLPILIHDSFLFKNVEDHAVEVILDIYTKANKQIFISFDKIGSYSESSQNTIKSNQIIFLSPNGNELFGRAWNVKDQK